jgi:hypothetical protein
MLMINNHFARFQLPGNLLKTKKCAPYFRGNMQFPIYLFFELFFNFQYLNKHILETVIKAFNWQAFEMAYKDFQLKYGLFSLYLDGFY